MKRAISLLLPMLLLIAAPVYAETPKLDPQKANADKLIGAGLTDGATAAPPAVQDGKPGEVKGSYIIHFTNGGSLETDNYVIEKDSVKVTMPEGTIYLDKSMIKSVEQVAGPEGETVHSTPIERPSGPAPAPPAWLKKGGNGAGGPSVSRPSAPYEQTDNNGHDESWWKLTVEEWQKKKKDAEERYEKAKLDWDSYNGTIQSVTTEVPRPLTPAEQKLKEEGGLTTTPTTTIGSQYDIIRYQDLRGSARVDMDRAQAELDAANKMLNETLPDEARRAGAPPGWAR